MIKRYADEVSASEIVAARKHKIKGTSGNDVLVGTDGDDRFILSYGTDQLVGGQGGTDSIKFGSLYWTDSTTMNWTLTAKGINGTIVTGSSIRTTFFDIDSITAKLGSSTDRLNYFVEAVEGRHPVNVRAEIFVQANYLNLVFAESLAAPLRLNVDANGVHSNVGKFSQFGYFTATGGAGDDQMSSTEYYSVTFTGGAGDDTLTGGSGNDILVGGVGEDVLTGGTYNSFPSSVPNTDTFVFAAGDTAADAAHADLITDFQRSEADRIDLKAYDAIARTVAVDAFTFIGNAAFSGKAGELRSEFQDGDTLVSGNTNDDRVADFTIRLTGEIALTAADFVFAPAAIPAAAAHPFAAHVEFFGGHALPLA